MIAMKTYNKFEVAKRLGITPSRVKQLARELMVQPERGPRGEYLFAACCITEMKQRNKKPGPKGVRK